MRGLFYRYNSICEGGILAAFQSFGIEMEEEKTEVSKKDVSPSQCVSLMGKRLLEKTYDFVFSVNFYPALSETCNLFKIPYISWTVDSPVTELYSDAITNEWNRLFLFDRADYLKFSPRNPQHIYHLPLATDMEHNEKILGQIKEEDRKNYGHEVCFIGSFYKEKCPYHDFEKDLPDYLRGYFEALMEAQYLVYGYNFMENCLSDAMIASFHEVVKPYSFPEKADHDYKGIIAQVYLNTRITEMERYRMLGAVSEHFPLDVYTGSDVSSLPRVQLRGYARSTDEMPKIFHLSKINLNLTSKAIRSGLPLRIWDVLGCGGFLITNYQEELPEYFTIGEDLEAYSSQEELLDKIAYYLQHEEERARIAKNGFEKVKQLHSYRHRVASMIQTVFG